ncbi:hypothetical protein K0M31_009196 [Melipona bicolor]|uniref:Uncharacterized protein n=1 Tax=Melipona bicolor TaxID=60889 RepID=A0AA40KJP3_9HYME|nr:hypothetical protein K0M31_009196 [Melipona bicolor]
MSTKVSDWLFPGDINGNVTELGESVDPIRLPRTRKRSNFRFPLAMQLTSVEQSALEFSGAVKLLIAMSPPVAHRSVEEKRKQSENYAPILIEKGCSRGGCQDVRKGRK